ncbi:hypothetical protein ACFQY0_04055 [Haloferula chungangensis]|uniref:Zinc ribbon domain-containing protein n=1 Tax=Haloferula chungangensis TaxID=1048331 RepID=A0ABW2L446_9BACT
MKITKVCCQGCGADLEVDEAIRFVNCNYCGAKLEVIHDATTTHTRLLEKLERQTGEMAEDLKVIRLQNDLEKLDREWDREMQGFMVTGKNGERSIPSAGGSVVGGGVAIVFGVIWMSIAGSIGAPGPFVLFGLVFIGFAFFGMVNGATKANRYQGAQRQMEARRRALIGEIERAKR